MAMENTGERVEEASCSATATRLGLTMDDSVLMPTTAQLMEVIKHINPFDQKFREANEAMKAGDFSQVCMLFLGVEVAFAPYRPCKRQCGLLKIGI